MKIIGKKVLSALCDTHAGCRDWIENWIDDVSASDWKMPQDIKARYSTASFLADNVVIFNVRGNNYRIETQVAYRTGSIIVRWGGSHAEYTRRYGNK
jgi:mRNA interferase HigB